MVGIQTIPVLYLTVLIHESGRAIMAKSLGLSVGKFQPYYTVCGRSYSFGCTTLNETSLSRKDHIWFASGGMLATRLFAEGIDAITNRIPNKHARLKQTTSIAYFMTRLDMPRYIIMSALKSWVGKPAGRSNEAQIIVHRLSGSRKDQKLIYIGLVTVVVADLLLDWKELRTNWGRVWMKSYN